MQKIIEKHIALDFNVKNAQDWKASFNESKFRDMVKKIRLLEKLWETNIYLYQKEKKSIKWAKRYLCKKNIRKNIRFNLQGSTFAQKDLIMEQCRLYTELLKKNQSQIL